MNEFTIPMKVKWIPLRRCEECERRKMSTSFYQVHDTSLHSYVNYNVCKRCMKEAKKRASLKNE